VAFEAKKAYDAASPLAKSTLADLAQAAKSAKSSFDQAMADAEAKALRKASEDASAAAEQKKPPTP
jgi:hypothetical protein